MVIIQNIDEFNRIKDSKFGFVVFASKGQAVFHKPECKDISPEDFMNIKPESGKSFHWYSTISLIEKEFPEIISCQICNPD